MTLSRLRGGAGELARHIGYQTGYERALHVFSTGAAASQCVTPRGVRQFGGLWGGGTPPPPWLTQTLGVGGSGDQPPGPPGGVGGYPNIHTSK